MRLGRLLGLGRRLVSCFLFGILLLVMLVFFCAVEMSERKVLASLGLEKETIFLLAKPSDSTSDLTFMTSFTYESGVLLA